MLEKQSSNHLLSTKKKTLLKVFLIPWNLLLKLQRFILIICSLFIVLGMVTAVFFRYVLDINFMGLNELILILSIWMYFIGAALGSYERSHISADLVSSYIKNKRIKNGISLFNSILTVILSFLFIIWSYDLVAWGLEKNTVSNVLGIPMIVAQSSILVGFVLMFVYSIAHLIQDLSKLFVNHYPNT